MAKQQKGGMLLGLEGIKNLSILSLNIPNLNTEPLMPKINSDIIKNIKPIGEQFKEALEPVYVELARVTGELEKANERAENAEKRASIAEKQVKRANRKTFAISILAIVIPFCQAAYYDYKNQGKDKELTLLSTTVKQLYQRIKTLKGELFKARETTIPLKTQSSGTKVSGSKKS
jgi:hypothetical protein